MLYPKVKKKKTNIKKHISNQTSKLKNKFKKIIKSFSSIKQFVVFLKKSFHI